MYYSVLDSKGHIVTNLECQSARNGSLRSIKRDDMNLKGSQVNLLFQIVDHNFIVSKSGFADVVGQIKIHLFVRWL